MTCEDAWDSLFKWNEYMIMKLEEKNENYPYDDYILMSLDLHKEFKKQMNTRIKR